MSCIGLHRTGWAAALLMLLAVDVFGGEPAAKKLSPAEMVAALVNKNSPPKYVDHESVNDTRVPLFAANYDWKEYARVRKAIFAIDRGMTPELWQELLRHFDDKRYSITLLDVSPGLPDEGPGRDFTVGELCEAVAYCCVSKPYERHWVEAKGELIPGRLIGPSATIVNLAAAGKNRAAASLWKLQVEACADALKNVDAVEKATVEQTVGFRKHIQAEIDKLKAAKKPTLFPHYLCEGGASVLIEGWHEASYGEEFAANLRKKYAGGLTPNREKKPRTPRRDGECS